MGKHEAPPFRMVVERGKLIPATPFDAERLDAYRSGVEVRVRFTEDRDRVMVRKWWAILNRAVKECKTPWKNAAQASEAVKLAIGVVNYTKTVGGEFMAYPKSLTELDDPELTDAVEQMIDVIYHVTGVDPAEWRKHVADMRDDDPEPQSTDERPSPSVDGSEGVAPPPAADQSEQPATETADSDEVSRTLSDDDRAWLKTAARMMWAATGKGEQETLKSALDAVRNDFTPEGISQAARDKGTAIFKQCKLVCYGEADNGDALEMIAAIAGVEPKEVVSNG